MPGEDGQCYIPSPILVVPYLIPQYQMSSPSLHKTPQYGFWGALSTWPLSLGETSIMTVGVIVVKPSKSLPGFLG